MINNESEQLETNSTISYAGAIAIIVAIEEYRYSKIPKVKYALNDALELKSILVEFYGVLDENIYLFTNSEASKTVLEQEIKYTVSQLGVNSQFIFYYAGHGFYAPDGNRLTAWDSSIDNLSDTTISFKDILLEPLKDSKCSKVLIFLDTCAQHIKTNLISRDIISDLNERELKEFLLEVNFNATYFSCMPGQKSHSDDSLQHGIWSYFLFQALTGKTKKALSNEIFLTDTSLRDYLKFEVPNFITNNTDIKSYQSPYALIAANSSFCIQQFYGKEKIIGNATKIKIIISTVGLLLTNQDLVASKQASGFKINHYSPDRYSNSGEKFIQSIFEKEISDELQSVYTNTKNLLTLRRSQVKKTDLGYQGSVETEKFKYTIQVLQSKSYPNHALFVRKLNIKVKKSEIPANIDQIFPKSLRTIQFKIEVDDASFNSIVEQFEDLVDKEGGKLEDDDREQVITYSPANGFKIIVNIKDKVMTIKTSLHITTVSFLDLVEQSINKIIEGNYELLSLIVIKYIKFD